MPPSLRDVAAAAQCSVSTASRALAGHPTISAATTRRVEAAARRLGYETNGLARSLRLNSSRLIGLVIPRVEAYNYTASTAQLHDVLSAEGYEIVLCCHNDDPSLDQRILRQLVTRRVDGVVHVPCSDEGARPILAAARIPFVELLRRSLADGADVVVPDTEFGSYSLTRHLIDLGHQRIALVSGTGFDRTGMNNGRIEGFKRAIADSGLEAANCPMVIGRFDLAAGRAAGEALIASGKDALPTAIVTGSAPLTIGLLGELHKAAIAVPRDVSVASLANVDWVGATNPPLTTYEFPLAEVGMLAAQMVLNRIRPQLHTDPRPSMVTLSGHLVVRESTAAPRESVLTGR